MRSAGPPLFTRFYSPSRGKTSNHTPHTPAPPRTPLHVVCLSSRVCCLRHCGLVSACERVTQQTVHSTVQPVHAHMHNTAQATFALTSSFHRPPSLGVVGARVYSQRRVRSVRSAGRDFTRLISPRAGKTKSAHTPHARTCTTTQSTARCVSLVTVCVASGIVALCRHVNE